LKNIRGVKISKGVERWGCRVYLYKISKFQGDVPPIFKDVNISGVFIFTKKCMVCKI
jgi:hypothetical protein